MFFLPTTHHFIYTLRNNTILASDLLEEMLDHSTLQGCRPAEDLLHASQMPGRDLRMRDQKEQQRRHDEQDRRPVLLEAGNVVLGRELGHGDEMRAHVGQIIEDRVEAVDVEEGQNREGDLVEAVARRYALAQARVRQLQDVGHEVAVGQHDALGDARGARAVGQDGDVRRLDRGQGDLVRRRGQEGSQAEDSAGEAVCMGGSISLGFVRLDLGETERVLEL